MPRKTKKTSIAKPAVTKPHDCSGTAVASVFGTLLVGGIIYGLVCLLSGSAPEVGDCYKNLESDTIAKIDRVYKYSEQVEYTYFEAVDYNPYLQKGNNTRTFGSFEERYEKLDNCNSYERRSDTKRYLELLQVNSELRTEIEELRAKLKGKK